MSEYKHIKKLGEGTYGIVFKVEKDGIFYADKQYKDELDLNEIDVVCRFSHKNLIACVDFFLENNQHHLILELADSKLNDQIVQSASDSDRIIWCYQLAGAVSFIHDQGYNHCDLKPDNILLKNNIIKVADFGLTYPIETNQVCGTTTWSSFELKMNEFDFSNDSYRDFFENIVVPLPDKRSSDIFSVGLLFIYILTGVKIIEDAYRSHSSFTRAYIDYIETYPKPIIDLPLDDSWKDLLIKMCEPFHPNRIENIQSVLQHDVFKSRSLHVPISGSVRVNTSGSCSTDGPGIARLFEWLFELCQELLGRDCRYLTMYICIDLYYKLYGKLNISQSGTNHNSYGFLCLFMAIKVSSSTSITIDEAADFAKIHKVKFMSYYNQAVTLLRGVFRSYSVYDLAVSERECQYGLFCALNCKLSKLHARQLHHEYTTYEENDMIAERVEKTVISNFDFFTKENIQSFNALVSKFESDNKIPPPVLFQLAIERRSVNIDTINRCVLEFNRENEKKTTLGEIKKTISTIFAKN